MMEMHRKMKVSVRKQQSFVMKGSDIFALLCLLSLSLYVCVLFSMVGGAAGGSKYFYDSIFFKFPVDKMDLYGGEEGTPVQSHFHSNKPKKSLTDDTYHSYY
jgi:hypothetical protein